MDLWSRMPMWAKGATFFAAVVALDAVRMSWGERRFVAAFAESILAIALYWGMALGSLAAGVFLGIKVFQWTDSHLLSWPVGIAAVVAIGLTADTVTRDIPGVGWRIEAMRNDNCHVDWDGRSNPTVCD